jgi:hypothetical protein
MTMGRETMQRIRSTLAVLLAIACSTAPAITKAQEAETAEETTLVEETATHAADESEAVPVPDEPAIESPTSDVWEDEEETEPAPSPPPAPAPTGITPIPGDIPIALELHGYYRARLAVIDNLPIPNPDAGLRAFRDGASDAAFGFMRLRLDPSIVFGANPASPVAALRAQVDVLDNVVFGDNARLAGTPLFANDPSNTSLFSGTTWSTDVAPIFFRRLWLEFMTPVGQIRIGRQASHGGMGLLFNDGNDFRNDFGDALSGTTFDRILFATRPLTIINTLTKGDSRSTPLIFAIAYDWLVEDQLTYRRAADPSPMGERGFADGARAARSPVPFAFLGDRAGEDDVWETTIVLAWNDPDFNMTMNARDELNAGIVLVNRGQAHTSSDVYIGDIFYRLRWSAFGRRAPLIYSEGELYTIQGRTNAVALTGDYCNEPAGCPGMTQGGDPTLTPVGRTTTTGGANVWGGAARLGLEDSLWGFYLESGFSTGQEGNIYQIRTLTQRPSNPAYQVGLLLYPVALNVRTANEYATSAIWSSGGVWNSIYFLAQGRYRPLGYDGGVEIIGQFLLGFADQLNAPLRSTRPVDVSQGCGIGAECLLGWEADVALKLSWGPHDEMRWSNEFGIMNVGDALGAGGDLASGNRLTEGLIWTVQSRIAFVF